MKYSSEKTKKAKDFIGRGVMSPESGRTPNESEGMGYYYGTGIKNPIGRVRDDTVGYRPVSRKQLGTPPTQVI